MQLKERIIAEVLARRESGVVEVDGDYEFDSLAKLEVISLLEELKPGLLDNKFNEIADAQSLDALLQVFDDYMIAEAAV